MDKGSITRYTLLVVAVVNAVLNLLGYQTIPDETTNDLIAITSGVVMLWAGWKNNYLSKKGRAQKEAIKINGLN